MPTKLNTVEVYYPYGLRVITLPMASTLWDAVERGHDIWEDEGEQVRVRVMRARDEDSSICICHLPPTAEQ